MILSRTGVAEERLRACSGLVGKSFGRIYACSARECCRVAIQNQMRSNSFVLHSKIDLPV